MARLASCHAILAAHIRSRLDAALISARCVKGNFPQADSRQAQTLERGPSGPTAYIRHDGQFEYGDV
jgi:hypothetical protein